MAKKPAATAPAGDQSTVAEQEPPATTTGAPATEAASTDTQAPAVATAAAASPDAPTAATTSTEATPSGAAAPELVWITPLADDDEAGLAHGRLVRRAPDVAAALVAAGKARFSTEQDRAIARV